MIGIISIIISIAFAISFPLLAFNNPYTTNSDIIKNNYINNQTIIGNLQLEGFYMMLFIAVVIIPTILLAVSKNKNVRYISFGTSLITLSYYIFAFKKFVDYAIPFFDNHPGFGEEYYLKVSSSSIGILFFMIIIAVINTAFLIVGMIKDRKQ